jgi:hypothetical protein
MRHKPRVTARTPESDADTGRGAAAILCGAGSNGLPPGRTSGTTVCVLVGVVVWVARVGITSDVVCAGDASGAGSMDEVDGSAAKGVELVLLPIPRVVVWEVLVVLCLADVWAFVVVVEVVLSPSCPLPALGHNSWTNWPKMACPRIVLDGICTPRHAAWTDFSIFINSATHSSEQVLPFLKSLVEQVFMGWL